MIRMVETKAIRVSLDTYNKLSKLGTLNDSFDTVIKRLLEGVKNKKND